MSVAFATQKIAGAAVLASSQPEAPAQTHVPPPTTVSVRKGRARGHKRR